MPISVSIDSQNDIIVVTMAGTIDENSDQGFKSLLSVRNGKVNLDLNGITAINSIGVRTWVNFMQNFRQTHEITLQNCPPDIIMQINMIPSFLGIGTVESFLAPFFCANCKTTFHKSFLVSDTYNKLLEELNVQACQTCGSECECEEIPSDYLRFMRPK